MAGLGRDDRGLDVEPEAGLDVKSAARHGVADALEIGQPEQIDVLLAGRPPVGNVAADLGELQVLDRGVELKAEGLGAGRRRIVEVGQRDEVEPVSDPRPSEFAERAELILVGSRRGRGSHARRLSAMRALSRHDLGALGFGLAVKAHQGGGARQRPSPSQKAAARLRR